MTGFGLGYRRELENHASLSATAKSPAITGAFAAPHSISHRAWRKAKMQGQVGSCSGFSRSSGEEILNFIATGGQVLHFSDMYCYLENQKACGLFGRDQGATIDGSCKAAKTTGVCRDDLFPYPGRYVTDIPDAAASEGARHLIRNHAVLRSYADALAWLASGVGVILIGVEWTSGMTRVGKTMELSDLRGSVLGGHAMVLEGYDGDESDRDGRPYLDLENSHGPDWGDDGWTLVAPAVIDRWAQNETLIGITDLQAFAPRSIPTYAEWGG